MMIQDSNKVIIIIIRSMHSPMPSLRGLWATEMEQSHLEVFRWKVLLFNYLISIQILSVLQRFPQNWFWRLILPIWWRKSWGCSQEQKGPEDDWTSFVLKKNLWLKRRLQYSYFWFIRFCFKFWCFGLNQMFWCFDLKI